MGRSWSSVAHSPQLPTWNRRPRRRAEGSEQKVTWLPSAPKPPAGRAVPPPSAAPTCRRFPLPWLSVEPPLPSPSDPRLPKTPCAPSLRSRLLPRLRRQRGRVLRARRRRRRLEPLGHRAHRRQLVLHLERRCLLGVPGAGVNDVRPAPPRSQNGGARRRAPRPRPAVAGARGAAAPTQPRGDPPVTRPQPAPHPPPQRPPLLGTQRDHPQQPRQLVVPPVLVRSTEASPREATTSARAHPRRTRPERRRYLGGNGGITGTIPASLGGISTLVTLCAAQLSPRPPTLVCGMRPVAPDRPSASPPRPLAQ